MPIFEITSPEGKTFEITAPEGATQEQVLAYAQENAGKPAPSEPSTLETLARAKGLVTSGVIKGITGLGEIVEEAALHSPASQIVDAYSGRDAAGTETLSGQARKLVERHSPVPSSTTEKYIDSIAQGVGGALPTAGLSGGLTAAARGANAMRGLVVGGVAGAGGQAGEQLMPGNPAVGRIAGSLVGGLTAAGAEKLGSEVAARLTPNSAARREIVKLITDNVEPKDLERSAATMRDVSSNNLVNLTGAQAMPGPSALDELQTVLAQHPRGTATQAVLRRQPDQVSLLASQMEGAGGGAASSRGEVSRQAQAGADEVIQSLKAKARTAFQQEAADAQPFDQTSVKALDKQLQGYAKAHPSVESLQTMVTDLRRRLLNPASKGDVSTEGFHLNPRTNVMERVTRTTPADDVYLSDPLQMKEGIVDAFGKYQPQGINVSGAQAVDAHHTNNLRDIINGLYETSGGALSRANKAFSRIYEQEVDPARAGVVGSIAGRAGLVDDVATPEGKLFSLLGRGTTNPQKSDIVTLSRELNKRDKELVPNIVSTYIDHTVKNVADSGSPDLSYSKKIHNAFFGSEAKRQGVRDMVRMSGEARGLSQEELRAAITGIDRYAQIFQMASKVPSNIGGTTAGDIRAAAGSTPIGEVAAIGSRYMPLRLLRTINEGKANQAMAYMDKLITTPEGMELLARMGREKGLTRGWANLVSTGFATLGQDDKTLGEVSNDTPTKE
jgi:hypothetical protein